MSPRATVVRVSGRVRVMVVGTRRARARRLALVEDGGRQLQCSYTSTRRVWTTSYTTRSAMVTDAPLEVYEVEAARCVGWPQDVRQLARKTFVNATTTEPSIARLARPTSYYAKLHCARVDRAEEGFTHVGGEMKFNQRRSMGKDGS